MIRFPALTNGAFKSIIALFVTFLDYKSFKNRNQWQQPTLQFMTLIARLTVVIGRDPCPCPPMAVPSTYAIRCNVCGQTFESERGLGVHHARTKHGNVFELHGIYGHLVCSSLLHVCRFKLVSSSCCFACPRDPSFQL